jgi:hypothetical protein
MQTFRNVAALLLMALTAACTSPVKEGERQGIRRIAVASACAMEATKLHVGLTAFANTRSSGDITHWKLDEHLLGLVQGTLSPRFEVLPARFDPAALLRKPGLMERRPQPSEVLQADGSIDAYLVIRPLAFEEGVRAREGVGVYSQFNPLFDRGPSIYTVCSFALYDRTLARNLAWADLRGFTLGSKALRVDTWNDYTPAQQDEISKEMRSNFERELPGTLRKLGLLSFP